MPLVGGSRFLVDTQNRDGSWGAFESARPDEVYLGTVASHDAFRIATSALCCMALLEVAGEDSSRCAALNKGLRYLMTEPPEARATSDVFYHTWSLIYVTQCFARAILKPYREIPKDELTVSTRRWLRMLQQMQSADGGWAYYDFGYGLRTPSGYLSTSFMTAAVLCALWDAEKAGLEVNPMVKQSALKCLERLRTPDKSFAYGTYLQLYPESLANRPKGALGRTQSCNLMLFRYGQGVTIADLKLGLDRMFQEHHFMEIGLYRPYPHEAWYGTSGYYFFFGHFYAATVIAELPLEEQPYYWKSLARVLLECQQSDGSWWDFPCYGYHRAYGTAYALLALARLPGN